MDRDLIRLIGKPVATISDYHAKKYIAEGKAKPVNEEPKKEKFEDRKKSKDRPPEDKTVWYPPEKKVFSSIPVKLTTPFPGPNDVLFTNI